MTVCLWKRFSLLLLLVLTLVAFGCSKKVAAPPPPPPPPPAPPTPPPAAPTITLTVDRASIQSGQSAVLSYTSTNATAVTINPGIGAVQPAGSGTRQITPTATTSFTARATGPGGTADSAAVNVVVTPAPAAAKPAAAPVVAAPAVPTRTLDEIFRDTMVSILFDYDKATIRSGEESKLLNNATWLKQNPTVRFTIEGHADERGSQEYNIALGDERAATVMKFLAAQGIAENRMKTISYGEERPSCREQTEGCFQQNRRAAFARIP